MKAVYAVLLVLGVCQLQTSEAVHLRAMSASEAEFFPGIQNINVQHVMQTLLVAQIKLQQNQLNDAAKSQLLVWVKEMQEKLYLMERFPVGMGLHQMGLIRTARNMAATVMNLLTRSSNSAIVLASKASTAAKALEALESAKDTQVELAAEAYAAQASHLAQSQSAIMDKIIQMTQSQAAMQQAIASGISA